MNFIDNIISFIDPEKGYNRAKFRHAENVMRSFEGASKGRRGIGWKATGAGANTENRPAKKQLMCFLQILWAPACSLLQELKTLKLKKGLLKPGIIGLTV
jgi:hypothetical protein